MSKFVQYGAPSSSPATNDTSVKTDLNILIIVDVQNCFISGGSMGNKNLSDSIQQMKEIETLIERNDLIVCSRDFHPMGHFSTKPFPYHCRDAARKCDRYHELKENPSLQPFDFEHIDHVTTDKVTNVSDLIKKNETPIKQIFDSIDGNNFEYTYQVIGTDLSYLFMLTKYAKSIKDLIDDTGKIHTIGLEGNTTFTGSPNIINIKYKVEPVSEPKKDFIQLTKGEYCKYDSFSAFAYHVELYGEEKFDTNRKSIGFWNNLVLSEENSTGLWEYLVEYINNKKSTDVTITVCGLVGNICVMYTAMHGSALWETIYIKKLPGVTVNFIYELYGTLFYCDGGASLNGDFKSVKYDDSKFNELKKNDNFTDVLDILQKSQNLVNYFKKKAEVSGIKKCEFKIMYNTVSFDTISIQPPVMEGGNIYKQKYLKYKQKYLELKNQNYL